MKALNGLAWAALAVPGAILITILFLIGTMCCALGYLLSLGILALSPEGVEA